MTDEHDLHDDWSDDELMGDDVLDMPEDTADETGDIYADDQPGDQSATGDEDHLLSVERFDDELARLEPDALDDSQGRTVYARAQADAGEDAAGDAPPGDDLAEAIDDDRLRGPRAQTFRRRLRDQVSMLPLALWLLALGAFLLAREHEVAGLPDLSTLALGELSVLAVATTMVVHALLSGRRERGLLFLGLWIWVTAGMVTALVYGLDDKPDAAEWWPLGLWSLGITFLLTYILDRTHDARLVLLSTVILVMGLTAYAVTSDQIGQSILDHAADYWPLLFTVLGVILLPLAFRRRV